jgi:hypothetical protein
MASIHLPWFLDGKLVSSFRGRPYVDGSFLAGKDDYLLLRAKGESKRRRPERALFLGHNRDPALDNRSMLDFVKAVSPDGIWNMLEDGKCYAKFLEEQGMFSTLSKKS